ncbi:MAG: HAD hydrolase family protein [Pigmentiphaga sp.]|nr:HAD hydrolase family protein [Pigmentiphaga sp.]
MPPTTIPTVPHPADALVLARIAASVRDRAAAVRLMVFDVDGILTDGSLWYGEHGETIKRFNVLDGQGLRLLSAGGVAVAWITARGGPAVTRRAADLGVADLIQGVHHKGEALQTLMHRHGLGSAQIGYMGDDINDLPAMQLAGLAVTVPEAPAYVAQVAHWVTAQSGGHGAVRECCDVILAAQGRLGPLIQAGSPAVPAGGTLQ